LAGYFFMGALACLFVVPACYSGVAWFAVRVFSLAVTQFFALPHRGTTPLPQVRYPQNLVGAGLSRDCICTASHIYPPKPYTMWALFLLS
ncbi:hypothetical protein WCE02_19500, partial [Pseudomonas juntendi]|uniref:hypothetical protein n=1 Tax=Pseudomonas juntendi TaxID=2666183 RepID=UPI0034D538B1